MSTDRKRLLELFARLSEAQRRTLLEFAEFLAARSAEESPEEPGEASRPPVPEPEPIPRPDEETVVAAIRRLSRSYHMLDKKDVLHQASALMAQHIMQGRDAVEVIDELEVVFRRHYHKLIGGGDERQ